MNNLSLNIESFNQMPIEKIISLYQQGYRLEERKSIKSLEIKSLATCPTSIVQGNNGIDRILTVTPTGGTPPYTKIELLVDGVSVVSKTGSFASGASIQIPYRFPESAGVTHKYESRTTDSCTPPNIVTDVLPCNIMITVPTACTSPKWKCVNKVCVSDNCDGTGTQLTQADCLAKEAACIPPANNYGCDTTGKCVAGAGTLPPGCNNTCVAPSGCPGCDLTTSYCIAGQCIKKSYALYGGIGLVAILLLKG